MQRLRYAFFVSLLICTIFAGWLPPGSALAQNGLGAQLYAELTGIKANEGEDAAFAYFESLSPKKQAAVTDFMSQVYISDSGPAETDGFGVMASGCWDRSYTSTGKSSITGEVFWRMNQSVYFCGNGSTVTYLSCSSWASTPGFGWGGGITSSCQRYAGGQGYSWFRYFTTARFYACWNSSCPISSSPRIYQQGEGNGAYAGWRG